MKFPACHLIFHAPSGKIKYPLNNGGANIIGRKARLNPPDVNVLVDANDGSMSRRHACIDIRFGMAGPVFLLSDLSSQNGTVLINRQRQQMKLLPGDEVYLQDGFIIRLGQTELTFEILKQEVETALRG